MYKVHYPKLRLPPDRGRYALCTSFPHRLRRRTAQDACFDDLFNFIEGVIDSRGLDSSITPCMSAFKPDEQKFSTYSFRSLIFEIDYLDGTIICAVITDYPEPAFFCPFFDGPLYGPEQAGFAAYMRKTLCWSIVNQT